MSSSPLLVLLGILIRDTEDFSDSVNAEVRRLKETIGRRRRKVVVKVSFELPSPVFFSFPLCRKPSCRQIPNIFSRRKKSLFRLFW